MRYNMKTLPETINVYRLVSPVSIANEKNVLAQLLFGLASANDKIRNFSISPLSGTLTYSDYSQLWENTSPDSLPNGHMVEAIARTFFEIANLNIINFRARNKKSKTTFHVSSKLASYGWPLSICTKFR